MAATGTAEATSAFAASGSRVSGHGSRLRRDPINNSKRGMNRQAVEVPLFTSFGFTHKTYRGKIMIGVFLDDWRHPDDVKDIDYPKGEDKIKWYRATSVLDFTMMFEECGDSYFNGKSMPDAVSFDYDLCDDKGRTGIDCLRFLVEFCEKKNYPLPVCYFHSADPNNRRALKEYHQLVELRASAKLAATK